MESQAERTTIVPLKGVEKLMCASDGTGCIIAHVAQIRGNIGAVVSHAPRAWREVLQRHPKMRARLGRDRVTAVVHSTVPEAAVNIIVSSATSLMEWQHIIYARCEDISNYRKQGFPFALHILRASPDEDSDTARIIVYSDHWASDGFSGMRVIHDFLAAVVRDTAGHPDRPSLPTLTPAFDLYFGKVTTTGFSLPVYLANLYVSWLRGKFRCVMPVSTTAVTQESALQSTALFATGTAESLASAIARCREERTSLHGAFMAALVAVFSRCPGALNKASSHARFFMDIDFNLRKRVTPSLGDDHVGNMIGVVNMPAYTGGVSLSSGFWDHARSAKVNTDKGIKSMEAKLTLRLIDTYSSRALSQKQDAALFGDLNFSNMGKYPFPITHEFPDKVTAPIEVEHVHFFNSMAGFGPALNLFVTSVSCLNYSLYNRADSAAGRSLFGNIVKVFESIGSVRRAETIAEVAERVLGPAFSKDCPAVAKVEV